MIPEVPSSKILLVLATIVAVVALISSWVPQVTAVPLAPTDHDQKRVMCSSNLSYVIQEICAAVGTIGHGDLYTTSSEKRRKRDMQNVASTCCKQGGCSYSQLRQYCRE
ncbi:probable insulin-like peptide 6 isoform X2 [Drosophila eugracilis]|nr:probable insulin-like peptide 6 isoform X2 [Drosophila eugracilis]